MTDPATADGLTAVPEFTVHQSAYVLLDSEGRMIKTRNEVLGNSKTAQRLADDEALNDMMGLVEQVRGATTGTGAVMKGVTAVLERMFGFRADTAAIVADAATTPDAGPVLSMTWRRGFCPATWHQRLSAIEP